MTTPEPQTPPVDASAAPKPDLSKLIRTYAKDLAQISGKANAPRPVAATPVPPKPVQARDTLEREVSAPEPFFERVTPPEPKQQKPIELPTVSKEEVESVAPREQSKEEREAVLARLRAKMASHEAPVFAEAPAPTVHPIPPVYREPIPEPVKAPPLPPPVAPAPLPVVDTTDRFHSYSTDFKDKVSDTKASSFSVIAAQQDAAKTAPTRIPSKSRLPIIQVFVGVILLVLASGGAYALYLYIGARQAVPAITLSVPSLIAADEYKKIEGSGTELMRVLAMVASEPLVTGNALVTYVAQPATGEPGVIAGTPAPGGVLIKELGLQAPDLLLRNIDEASTVGVIHEGGENRAFFVLRVSSYERTFAGMLTWEPLMERELGLLYPLYPEDVVSQESAVDLSASTTPTASSTPPKVLAAPAVSLVRFADAIVANRDVRVLRDSRGRSLVLYGYADKETLIIARNEAAFASLITRLAAKK